MELLFIRHAQPTWVEDGKAVLDPGLTEDGHRQAQHLADRARHWGAPTALFVSPTRRTRETAAPLEDALGVKGRVVDWLEEIRLPSAWEGAPAHEIGEHFSKARARTAEQWWEGIPGGERFFDFQVRIEGGLVSILAEHGAVAQQSEPTLVWRVDDRDTRLVFIAHGGTNAVAISWLLGLPMVPWAWERFVCQHASITRLRASRLLGGRVFGLREHSDNAHVPEDLRSR